MPILKQLSHTSQSKRRSRADLTAEMISAPMGDFRHTMHVGRGGDAFGDTSFLSTRSGEAPRQPEIKQGSPGSKPSLLSRTFRSSKRSQSVNRGDKFETNVMAPSGGSSNHVKNAISLPYLNDEDANFSGNRIPKSVSSSPMKVLPENDSKPSDGKPSNSAVAMATSDAEFDECNFGELTDLPRSAPRGGGMKHAESIMSFHIDLGPSMLGDILSVMEKKSWEEDDLGYEEGEGRTSPSLSPPMDDEDRERRPRPLPTPARPPHCGYNAGKASMEPYTPELHTRSDHRHMDSCSVSSSGSAALEEKPQGDTDSAKDDRDFSFMDEDEDEIRV